MTIPNNLYNEMVSYFGCLASKGEIITEDDRKVCGFTFNMMSKLFGESFKGVSFLVRDSMIKQVQQTIDKQIKKARDSIKGINGERVFNNEELAEMLGITEKELIGLIEEHKD